MMFGGLRAKDGRVWFRSGLGAYFKWWGIYTQGDGVGAVGGKGGEGLASDYFMMRIGCRMGSDFGAAGVIAELRRIMRGTWRILLRGRISSCTG